MRRAPDGRINAGATLTASSQRDEFSAAVYVLDGNHATRWSASPDETEAWLKMDLGYTRDFARQELRLEYAWRPYAFTLESSVDGERWEALVDHTIQLAQGSPFVIDRVDRARFLRLRFPRNAAGPVAALFDWAVFTR